MLNVVGERTPPCFKLTLSGCVVYIYCVGFASLDLVNLIIVPGMFVCNSFPTGVCMFVGSKALLMSSVTVIVRAGGAIWLNPYVSVLFSVCSADIV